MKRRNGIASLVFVIVGCSAPNEQTQFTQSIEGTDYTIEMMPVQSDNGNFWISRTEVTWNLYDIFLHFINSPSNVNAGVDAVSGPTPAYGSVDRGFGRRGYPAISISNKAALSFCEWLSTRTNRTYSIPTIEQWKLANVGGGSAWHQWNSGKTTHPVATTEPNSIGIYDMHGNVGEWVITEDGFRVIGGSFRTPEEELGLKTILTPIKDWNVTDPQLPRSPWWYADADYVGLRLVTSNGESHE